MSDTTHPTLMAREIAEAPAAVRRLLVNNAEVCVDVGGSIISTHYPDPANPTAPARKVDAVIGSNLFDQAEILWDGPHRTIGILP